MEPFSYSLENASDRLASFPGLVDSKNNTEDRQLGLVLIWGCIWAWLGTGNKSSDFIDDFLGLFCRQGQRWS